MVARAPRGDDLQVTSSEHGHQYGLDLAIKARWPASRTLLTALAGTIPFLSFWFEHKRTRDVRTEYAV